ncbi:MAG: bifunctional hydroxymethylpyrimidine kinase/phosphomethylpyrimidine kinase [Dehalococcoidia bacterium]|nr:bifunctional hydroxymethylpyrimidine kinase/phosphomethylpyrimidine kinase [Dehalococcoidia bacterium]
MTKPPTAMTIAGSDSGGGAGIQADLKTFAALGVYGTSAITAITAQNTLGVTAIHEAPVEIIAAQIDAILTDIGADAVKTGMFSSSAIIETVARELKRHGVTRLVVDPVMVAKGGRRLLREDAVEALRTRLLPLATVVTPNIPEAEVLAGMTIRTPQDAREAARKIVALGAKSVVVKGGHLSGTEATDLFYDGKQFREFTAQRVDTKNTHGTGCTFASAIAAGLAKGLALPEAIGQAKTYVIEAIRASLTIGSGHGPLNHFYRLRQA